MSTLTTPAVQEVINDLQHGGQEAPLSAEDHAVLESWQSELDAERAEALGAVANISVSKLIELPDGTIVTEEEKKDIDDSGNSSGPYENGQR